MHEYDGPHRHGRARMGLFLSRGISHFFASSLFQGSAVWSQIEARSWPSIPWQRETAMAGALSRPKPQEAGAEGPPLRGSGHRRESAAEVGGPTRHRSLFNMPAFPRRVRARMDFPPFLILSERPFVGADQRPASSYPGEPKTLPTKRPNARSAMARDRGDGTNLDGGVLQP